MRILLRCDGGPAIGVGHVVRCLALAEEATSRGHEVAVTGTVDGEFLHALAAQVGQGLTLLGAPATEGPRAVRAIAADYDVVHVDHYDLGDDLLAGLRHAGGHGRVPGRGRRIGPILSNLADGRYGARPADLGIDPTPGAQYRPIQADATWWLRGERFVAIRRAVAGARRGPSTERELGNLKVLVVMGGTDAAGCAPLVVDALEETGLDLELTVIAGSGTRPALVERASRWSNRMSVLDPVTDLPARMAAADLVITAAGTSLWELCAMGQCMAAVAVVDNQRDSYRQVVEAGAALGLGSPSDLADTRATARSLYPLLTDPRARETLASTAADLIDGRGAWRTVSAWEAILGDARTGLAPSAVRARHAALADATRLWEWRNDPQTRAQSRSSEEVPLSQHIAWLESSLECRERLLLVGEDVKGAVGTVRWDHRGGGEWEVSITVAPGRRGQRLSGPLLAAGEEALARHLSTSKPSMNGEALPGAGLTAYLAVVHFLNTASRQLFLGSGYLPDLPPDTAGFERYVKFPLRRGPT